MAESITQRELRNDSGEIMRRLEQGESFVVTRNGVPVGELTPLPRHRFVPAAAVVAFFGMRPPSTLTASVPMSMRGLARKIPQRSVFQPRRGVRN